MACSRIESIPISLVFIDRFISEHGWRQDKQGWYQACENYSK